MTKYILALADAHCGHLVGLTPPRWQLKTIARTKTKRNKYYKVQKSLWKAFDNIVQSLPMLDGLIINGDMIDGKGQKSGGAELITSLMQEQADMACDVIDHITLNKCRKGYKIFGTFGTPYHTSPFGDQWENYIASKCQFDSIGAHEWIDVEGVIFDFKHHLGSSSVPHGRHTAAAKAGLWNDLWAIEGMQPKANIILRSHVHYFSYCGNRRRLCMTLPALQGMGSRFGALRCEGLVDFGMVLFEIKSKNEYNFYPFVHQVGSQKTKAVKL